MAKLLVIDKCCFQGLPLSSLLEFVRDYRVVLPYTLCLECLMSENPDGSRSKDPLGLLKRIEGAVKAGAGLGYAVPALRRMEKESCASVPTIVDEEFSLQIRKGIANLDRERIDSEAEICRKTFDPLVDMLGGLAETCFETVQEKGQSTEFRNQGQSSKTERLKEWLRVADAEMDGIARKLLPEVPATMKWDWYTWQTTRLWFAWMMEWAYTRNCSGPSFTIEAGDVPNDLHDMNYVASLSRADGLLSQDKKLVEPLARAAFPEKDVFSSLDEVPASYRCDWGGE
jgi:hypothetical protein